MSIWAKQIRFCVVWGSQGCTWEEWEASVIKVHCTKFPPQQNILVGKRKKACLKGSRGRIDLGNRGVLGRIGRSGGGSCSWDVMYGSRINASLTPFDVKATAHFSGLLKEGTPDLLFPVVALRWGGYTIHTIPRSRDPVQQSLTLALHISSPLWSLIQPLRHVTYRASPSPLPLSTAIFLW